MNVQSDTLLLADVFGNFRNVCLKIYEFDPAKGIRGAICHSVYLYAKANNKYLKDYDWSKKLSYLNYWHVNNLYGWSMSQKLPLNNFEWIKDISHFNERFYKER